MSGAQAIYFCDADSPVWVSGFDQQRMTHERLARAQPFEQEPALPPSLKLRRTGALTVRVLRGDGAGLAEEREEIQRPRRRPEDGCCMCDGGGGGGHLRGVYGGARAVG